MIALCGLLGIENAVGSFRPQKLITLLDPPIRLRTPTAVRNRNHLKLGVRDIACYLPLFGAPSRRHVRRLLEFGAHWELSERLLVHCAAGVSRSAAALLILLAQKNPGREHDVVARVCAQAHHIRPNRRLIRLGDELLGCSGRLVAAVERIPPPTLAGLRDDYLAFPTALVG